MYWYFSRRKLMRYVRAYSKTAPVDGAASMKPNLELVKTLCAGIGYEIDLRLTRTWAGHSIPPAAWVMMPGRRM